MPSLKNFQPGLLGWFQAFLQIFFFLGLGYIAQRLVAVRWEVDPMVWGCSAFMGAALVLLIVGQKGQVAGDVLRRPHTWVFGIFLITIAIINTFLFQQITSTEVTLLHRINLLLGFLIGWFFLNRKQGWDRALSALMIMLGVLLILTNIATEQKAFVYTSIAIISLIGAIRIFVAEFHPENNAHIGFHSRCCMAGIVTAVTSIFLTVVAVLIAYLQTLSDAPIAFLPELSDFTHRGTVYGGFVLGVLFVAPIRYLEFSSIRLIKSENYFAVAALTPIAVIFWESAFAGLGLLEIRQLSKIDLLAGVLITGGALLTVYIRIKREMGGHFDLYEYMNKVADEAKDTQRVRALSEETKRRRYEDILEDSMDCHDIVEETMETFQRYVPKVADLLGVPQEVITAIDSDATGELTVKPEVMRTLQRNYRQNVANTDALTGLRNRRYLKGKIRRTIGERKIFSLLFVDLDKFKPINDTYGHDAGDRVLQTVGNRLEEYIDKGDIVTRIGGDEFVLMIYGIDKSTAEETAAEIRELVAKPMELEGIKEPLEVTASIGIATYPEDGKAVDELLRGADERMYEDKSGDGR